MARWQFGKRLISLMVPVEVPIHKYFSEPQNYNPDGHLGVQAKRLRIWGYGGGIIYRGWFRK